MQTASSEQLTRKDEAELRADAGHLRLETANAVAGAAVATDFLVDIADHTDLKLLGQELRRAFSLRQLLTFDHAAMLFASD